MKYIAVFVMSITLLSCDSITGCDEDKHVVDAEYGSTFYDFSMYLVQTYEDRGYDCSPTAIRNAFGTTIGQSYTCSKCE
jgi:hypothetical protein